MKELITKFRLSYPAILDYLLILPSFLAFYITGKTSKVSYMVHRQLFIKTNGNFNDLVSSLYSKTIGKYQLLESEGIVGKIKAKEVQAIVNSINENGYHIFEENIDPEIIENLVTFAENEPASILKVEESRTTYSKEKHNFDINNIISPRYQYSADQMVKSDAVCKILLDENLLHIAQEYLQVKPIIDLVTMWWSAPFDNKGTNAAAQEFHFDMDRIKFLKFFIYLTDVNPNTGPHCYVPKSHKKLPKALRKDGRFSDALVKENVGEPIEISGKKGTLLAVDTRGLHKGKPLTEGHRLLFQLEFTNSLFGQSYPLYNIPSTVKANFQEMSKKYKRTFKNFRSS